MRVVQDLQEVKVERVDAVTAGRLIAKITWPAWRGGEADLRYCVRGIEQRYVGALGHVDDCLVDGQDVIGAAVVGDSQQHRDRPISADDADDLLKCGREGRWIGIVARIVQPDADEHQHRMTHA